MADKTDTQVRIEPLLDEVIKRKASDLHIQVGLAPILRVDGKLAPVPGADVLNEEGVEALIFAILDEDQKQILLKDKEFDFSFAYGDLGRFRVNAFHERGNLAAALRLIPNELLTTEQLGLPPIVDKFSEYPRGLVLVTGPTGSGKSTTLAALVDKINRERAEHIVTIEDPIEFTHSSKKSVVVQREVHYDTYSFSAALRSSLREDPDVVLIGEMRDLETIAAAITIAETGHLVFATLHTNSAAQSIDRMIDVFPPHQQPQIRSQLANILMAICSQRLVPSIGGGRIAAAEIMIATPAVRNIIREGKSHQLEAVIQTGGEFGMQSMDKTLVGLIQAGSITYDEARNVAVDIEELNRMMRG
ncbi:MAG: type IV pilus twitching motility protein PilT [Candidatus Saccharimonadales bacterium]